LTRKVFQKNMQHFSCPNQ